MLVINLDIGDVVLEDGGDVDLAGQKSDCRLHLGPLSVGEEMEIWGRAIEDGIGAYLGEGALGENTVISVSSALQYE